MAERNDDDSAIPFAIEELFSELQDALEDFFDD